MCGIYARIHKDKSEVNSKHLQQISLVAHRGPDGFGFYHHLNVGLAHQRLAIYDLSEEGQQPMHRHHLHIIFNGSIYNHVELKNELSEKGYIFSSKSDTELILHAFHKWGMSCFEKFIGQWAIIIYDEVRQEVVVCRDRYGIKPLYIYEDKNLIAFGSEQKLFATPSEINIESVSDFIHDGITDISKRSFFNHISEVEPGQYAIISLINLQINYFYYYRILSEEDDNHLLFEDAVKTFKNLFESSLAFQLRSDVPIGMSLSGGMDSNAIVNFTKQLNFQPHHCFTVQFHSKATEELFYAKKTIEKTSYEHHVIEPSFDQMLEVLPQVIKTQDIPIASWSAVAQYLLFREVKTQGIKVILSGQGADELLGGYDAHIIQYFRYLKSKDYYAGILYLLKNMMHKPQFFMYKLLQKKVAHSTKHSTLNSFSDFQYSTLKSSPLPALLRYEDRNSMAHGVESRLPYLDHRLVDFLLSLPASLIMNPYQRKPILAKAMDGIVPNQILQRKDKIAFSTPQNDWFKHHSKAIEKLKIEALQELINRDIHINLNQENRWRMIFAGLWLKHL